LTVKDMEMGEKLAEGKTKVIYAVPEEDRRPDWTAEDLAYMAHKDDITAGDGAKKDVIENKGVLSCRTTSAVYRHLEANGVPTHYVQTLDDRTMVVRRVDMVPIEWVARRWAAGSYLKRTGLAEGTRLEPLVLELFFKDDANHDPLITQAEAVDMGLVTDQEVETGLRVTTQVFEILERAWNEQDVRLVDLKIEFGRTADGELLLADVVDNDSWRLWPGGDRQAMLDKQVYRELKESSADALNDVRRRYEEVARRAEQFGDHSPAEAAS
jgi:phosphoribosylaminoimidazole-succinocarboxamide synthase